MPQYEVTEELWRRWDSALFIVRRITQRKGDTFKIVGEGIIPISDTELIMELS